MFLLSRFAFVLRAQYTTRVASGPQLIVAHHSHLEAVLPAVTWPEKRSKSFRCRKAEMEGGGTRTGVEGRQQWRRAKRTDGRTASRRCCCKGWLLPLGRRQGQKKKGIDKIVSLSHAAHAAFTCRLAMQILRRVQGTVSCTASLCLLPPTDLPPHSRQHTPCSDGGRRKSN